MNKLRNSFPNKKRVVPFLPAKDVSEFSLWTFLTMLAIIMLSVSI